MKYFADNSLSIGHTPLVQVRRVVDASRALVLAKIEEFCGKTFVVILPDSGERYLSTPLFASP